MNELSINPTISSEEKELATYYKKIENEFVNSEKSGAISTMGVSSKKKSENMDGATLTAWVDDYRSDDTKTFGHVLGINWEWSISPNQTWTDTVGFTWSGEYWAEDDSFYDGYYTNGITRKDIPINVKAHAAESKYDIRGASGVYKGSGRMYLRIMQTKSKVPEDEYFNLYGAYAHKYISIGSITLSADSGYRPTFSTSGAVSWNRLDENPFVSILTH
ncbi:hypothetical protein [Gottfriedia acidiceleris]|uniref:hypothetical protein n=1 Tax=Gottfriedia acidiceleris TaxID=371036 RepID=UPI001430CFE3|nr:hypothetical protein [Gottfriedia acidiceleris]